MRMDDFEVGAGTAEIIQGRGATVVADTVCALHTMAKWFSCHGATVGDHDSEVDSSYFYGVARVLDCLATGLMRDAYDEIVPLNSDNVSAILIEEEKKRVGGA